ncbi:MAG: tape measure protein, partial [Oscillospiraceae bacterium]
MAEASILIEARDMLSAPMRNMSASVKPLDKAFEDLNRRLEQADARTKTFNGGYVELTRQLDRAKAKMKEAKKAFKADPSDARDSALQQEIANCKNIADELDTMRLAARDARAEMRTLREDGRRLNAGLSTSIDYGGLRRDGDMLSPEMGGISGSSLLSGLGQSGLIQILGSSLAGAANVAAESALGQVPAAIFSNLLSGVTSGAAMGALSGHPLLGGAIGGAAGLITGGTQIYGQRDDAFQSYVQENFDTQLSERESMLGRGSAIAGSREQTQMAFAQRLGSDEAATAFLDKTREMAKRTNYSYDDITGYSKKLLTSYDPDETFGVLKKLSDATAGLNLDKNGVDMFISGLSRMRTTGKATQEYLNYFSERGLDVYEALAESTGADKKSIAGMVTKGQISGEVAAQSILDFIDKSFGGLSDKLMGTYDGMMNNLADMQADADAAGGEAYNAGRISGLQAQQTWMDGNGGTMLDTVNRAMGAYQADLENAKEQYQRDAIDAMTTTDAYQLAESQGNYAEMGRLFMEAKVQGMNAYNASDGAQLALASEEALAGAIREDAASNQNFWDAGYEKGNWFNKGLAAGMGLGTENVDSLRPSQTGYQPGGSSHAFGLESVPYDNFPALLHQGERVQTAAEARADRRSPGGVVVTGNTFH